MPVEIIEGVEHRYAPNPTMHGEEWAREHPPIETTAAFLRNKYTGDIVPNFPEFAERSDVYEPYLGDPKDAGDEQPGQQAAAPAPVSGGLASL